MANPLRVQVSELLRRPGSDKPFDLLVTIADLGLDDDRFVATEPVEVHLSLESLTDGIVVNGRIDATWHGTCRRCAMPAEGALRSEVHELYQIVVTDPEAFELTGDQLDLEPMVREVLGLDAIDGTPVIDLKPVMSGFLPRGAVTEPAWAQEIMRDYWKAS